MELMDDEVSMYLHRLVFAADHIADAAHTQNLRAMFQEIDNALAAPVPGDVYDSGMAVLTALAVQVDATTSLQGDRLAWAWQSRTLDPFLRGLPELATAMAAAVRTQDPGKIADTFQTSLEAAAADWPDPIVALAAALAMQIDTDVPFRIRNAWTLDIDTDDEVPTLGLAVAA